LISAQAAQLYRNVQCVVWEPVDGRDNYAGVGSVSKLIFERLSGALVIVGIAHGGTNLSAARARAISRLDPTWQPTQSTAFATD
jgi:hypothetical protein